MRQDAIINKVNETVIKGLESKGLKWFRPWRTGAANQPMNWSRKTFYNGFNIFFLNAVMLEMEYKTNQWLTFKQAKNAGGSVIKGQKGVSVYFCKVGYQDMKTGKYLSPVQIKTANLSEQITTESGRVIYRYRKTYTWAYYTVFNVDQCDDITPHPVAKATENVFNPNEMAENISTSYINTDGKLQLKIGGDRAYYNKTQDVVGMPKKESFNTSDDYYKTLFHELSHSTGHEDRLKRATLLEVNHWGDNTYAQEELVAEITAMYLSGVCGLNPTDGDENSQAYIKGWCKYLKDAKKECFYAMGQAAKSMDLIMGK